MEWWSLVMLCVLWGAVDAAINASSGKSDWVIASGIVITGSSPRKPPVSYEGNTTEDSSVGAKWGYGCQQSGLIYLFTSEQRGHALLCAQSQ